jgi:hypothetical protein
VGRHDRRVMLNNVKHLGAAGTGVWRAEALRWRSE